MVYSESILVPVSDREDFPEGLGFRVSTDEPLCVDAFLRENSREVVDWLRRFELLVFSKTKIVEGMDSIYDQFFPMHVDRPFHHPDLDQQGASYVTCLRLLDARRKDPTHFAALEDYADALRSWKSAFVRSNAALSNLGLVHAFSSRHRNLVSEAMDATKPALEASRRRARWAYERSALRYAHSWKDEPDSAVLYRSGELAEPKLVHGRLGTSLDLTTDLRMLGLKPCSGMGAKPYSLRV
ncbi:hypothetical protein IPG41_02340 [Candidatus Peregrinibacteria bacterium]|nr:MAG: hypothetical protein IPG41_02340 [Candidatus Peregrinibacteria bacterium]